MIKIKLIMLKRTISIIIAIFFSNNGDGNDNSDEIMIMITTMIKGNNDNIKDNNDTKGYQNSKIISNVTMVIIIKTLMQMIIIPLL